MLTSYVSDNQRDWDVMLAEVTFALRSTKHEATGLTPNFINFGREVSVDGAADGVVLDLDQGIRFSRAPILGKQAAFERMY